MQLTRRSFQGDADKPAMLALACAFPEGCLHVVDLPYRLNSRALDDAANGSLWFDSLGNLLAWAVMNAPWWEIDMVLHPGADEGLYRKILKWASPRVNALEGTPYARPSWYVMVFTDQPVRIRCLEEAGFKSQAAVGENSWSKVLMRRPGNLPVANYRLPQGFFLMSGLVGGEGVELV